MNIAVLQKIRKIQIKNTLLNTVANGLAAWLLLRSSKSVTLSGGTNNYPGDLAASAFLLLFIIGLIMIPIFRKKVRTGQMEAIEWNRNKTSHRILSALPSNPALAALSIGLFGLTVITPFTITVMYLLGITEMTPLSYAIFKGIWAGGLAGLSAGPIVLLGLASSKDRLATETI